MPGKETYVTVCPKCGSDNVGFENEAAYAATGLSSQFRHCNNCGFKGMIFPQIPRSQFKESDVKKISKTKEEPVQTSFGEGYFKYLIYVAIPIGILMLLMYVLKK
jgi:hypothetical protein